MMPNADGRGGPSPDDIPWACIAHTIHIGDVVTEVPMEQLVISLTYYPIRSVPLVGSSATFDGPSIRSGHEGLSLSFQHPTTQTNKQTNNFKIHPMLYGMTSFIYLIPLIFRAP